MRVGTVVLAAAGLAMVPTLAQEAAAASNGVAMNVDVTGATSDVTGCSDRSCTWTVTANVTAVNLTSGTLSYSSVSYAVDWEDSTNQKSGVVDNITVLHPGTPALKAGDTLSGTTVYQGVQVSFQLPRGATDGNLDVTITTSGGSGSGDAPFLSGGAPLPVSAIGALGAGVLVGGVLVVRSRRSSRRAHQAA
ncbi:MAG: hypothetical protein M0Z69_10850 [Actinomycetota bacterium]|nr:hypothetical protein [Actinomycetota bacterium]